MAFEGGPPSGPAETTGTAEKPAQRSALPASGFLLLTALTIFWGGNWPAMKIVLGELGVWPFRTICLIGGGLGLLLVARLGRLPLSVPRCDLGPLLICTLFNVVAWHLFSAYGVSLMAAGRASVIAFTMPLWAALLGHWVLGERITAAKVVGLGLGLAGMAVLIGPDPRSLGAAPLGALFMLGAALSWAAGTVAVKRVAWRIPTVVLTAWMLLLGAVPVAIGALLVGEGLPVGGLSTEALLAFAYVLVLPMMFCQWAYLSVVRLFPAVIAAIGTLAIPVVGVLSSALVLGETVGLRELAALALVCGALGAVLVLPALREARRA